MKNIPRTPVLRTWLLFLCACALGWHTAHGQSFASQGPPQESHTGTKTAALSDVLSAIKKRYHVSFLYNQQYVQGRSVTGFLNFNKPLEELLKEVLVPQGLQFEKMSDNYYTIFVSKTPAVPPAARESRSPRTMRDIEVRGSVTDTAGNRIPGVSVGIREKKGVGTSTDFNGKYILEVPDNATLVFSFIGYKTQEIPVSGRQVIDVVLRPEDAALREVVVVGFGTQKKVSVTGAISSVNVRELEQSSTPSLSNTIGGRLPGIITRQASGEPGYDAAQVFIRGMGTWVERAPLIFVDGVQRDMNNINAQEIESFTILKDASATAVYGVQGANGVILIKTRRGNIGKPQITFRTEGAMLTSLRIPEYITGAEYASLINEGLRNVGKPVRYTDEEIEKFRNGSDPYFYPNVDWNDVVFKRHTFQTINNLSITGGTPVIRYFVNVGFTQQEGIYKEDPQNPYNTNAKVKRYNFRSNVDINLSKNLKAELGLGGIIQRGNYPGFSADDIMVSVRQTPPLAFPVKNPDGSVGGILAFLGSNPWGRVTQSGYSTEDRSTLQGTFGLNWDLSDLVTPGLSVNGKFSYDRFHNSITRRHKVFAVRQYLGKDPATGEDLYQTHREEEPMGYGNENPANRALYTEMSVNYNRTFGKHTVTSMLLFNRRDYVNLSAPNSIENLPFRLQGLAGRLTYDYDTRYLAEFNFGYNGSENFPKGRRYGFFPSFSAGWVISNEKFWHVPAITQLKLRGSYGRVGNDKTGNTRRFLFLTTVNRSGQSYRFGESQQQWQGFDEGFIGYEGVTWEVASKTNLGMDLELLKGMVTFQVDAFREERRGILMQRRGVPYVVGFFPWSLPYGNLGAVNNQGLDAMLEIKKGTPGGLFYNIRGNITYAHNEIIENDEPRPKYPYLSRKGHPIDQPFGYVAIGFFKDQEDIDKSPRQHLIQQVRPGDIKFKDLNGDGQIDTYDQTALGYPRTPEIMYGFGGTVSYKGFDASIFFTGAARTTHFLDFRSMFPFADGLGSWNVFREYYDNRWTPDNPNPKYPAVIDGNNLNNYNTNTVYMKSGSYLRIKNAEIGYNFPQSVIQRLKVNAIRLFVNGMNLHTWDKLKVIDPESDHGTGRYPLQRSINVGAQVKF